MVLWVAKPRAIIAMLNIPLKVLLKKSCVCISDKFKYNPRKKNEGISILSIRVSKIILLLCSNVLNSFKPPVPTGYDGVFNLILTNIKETRRRTMKIFDQTKYYHNYSLIKKKTC